jgi:hypothetical protein
MKHVVFLSFLVAAFSASAISLYEPFDYDNSTDTNLIGRVSPDLITWNQSGPTSGLTNQPGILSGSLNYPGRPPARGNRVLFGQPGTSARFSLGPTGGARQINTALTGTLFYSFLFRVADSSTLNTGGVFWAGFNNTPGTQEATPSVVGARLITKADTNSPGNYLVGLSKNSGTVADFLFATNSFTTNDVVFVVVGYTWFADSGNDDYARMWVNPDPATWGSNAPPEAVATSFAGGDHGNFRSFVLFNRTPESTGTNTPKVELDELLIANNWADVTPRTNDMLAVPPVSQTVVAGNAVVFETRSQLADSIQWQSHGTNVPGATSNLFVVPNAQAADAGTYSVIYSNAAGTSVSNATLNVVSFGAYPSYAPLWSLAPGSRPYVTLASSDDPRQRSLAYSAASNQVLIVSTTNAAAGTTDPGIYVLDGTSGADLHALNADPGVINEGNILLTSVDVGDDGAVYACNMSDANQTSSKFKIYRWLNSDSNTVPERIFGPQEPAFSTTQHRWGDVMDVRGSGLQTEIALDENTGLYASIVRSNESLGMFWSHAIFQMKPRPSLGRSIQFGPGDSIWQKAKAVQYAGTAPLQNWTYTLDTGGLPTFNTALATNLDVFPPTLGPVAVDLSRNLLAGIDVAPVSGVPDALAIYDISNPANPILISRHNFPVNHQGNTFSFGRVVIAGDRIYALNANNGVLALGIAPVTPVPPSLSITKSGSDVIISWSTNASGYTLEATPVLASPSTWTNVGAATIVGDQYVVTNAAAGTLFYRLKK